MSKKVKPVKSVERLLNYMNDNIDYISEAFIKRMFNHLKYTEMIFVKNHYVS